MSDRASPWKHPPVGPVVFAAAASLMLAGCDGDPSAPTPDPNRPPVVAQAIPAQALVVGGSATLDLSVHFGDPDGDTLQFSATSADGAVAIAEVAGDTLTIRAVRQGTTAVTVTATDPEGLSVSQSVAVEVVNRPPGVAQAIPAQALVVGESVTLDLSVHFADPDDDTLEYSAASADSGVAVPGVAGDTLTIRAVRQGTTAVTVTATDPEGLSASQSVAVEVANRPPHMVLAIPAQTLKVDGRATLDLSVHFSDPDGDALEYTAASADSGVAVPEVAGDTLTIRAVRQGATAVTVTATDPEGLSASQSVAVEVANRPPHMVLAIPAQTLKVDGRATLDLSVHFSDPDGDALEYTAASADSGVAVPEVAGDTLTMRAVRQGATAVTITATDPEGLSASQSVAVEVAGVRSDRAALEALYHSTDGPNWNNNANWLSDAPLRDWYGVRTDDLGFVESLFLPSNRLRGPIPPELGGLANLRELYLFANQLTTVPPEIGNLSELEVLNLFANRLSGSIPPELGGLSKLKGLLLNQNELTGPIPPELGGLNGLEVMFLGANRLTGAMPSELGNLANLQFMWLGFNSLSGPIPPELGGLARLESLAIESNRLSGRIPPELGSLVSLKTMELDHNALTGRLPVELANLTGLESLLLGFNDLEGPIPAEFGSLETLTELEVTDNGGMSGALPASLTNLRLASLWTGGTKLCAPREPVFEAWVRTIRTRRIAACDGAMAYLIQAVQSRVHPVPLVAGEKALLRVFVTAARDTEEGIPLVRVTFFVGGSEEHVLDIPAKAVSIPTEVREGDLSSSANVEVPDWLIRPGLELVIEIDPEGTLDPELGVPKRLPETDRMVVDVREMPVFDVTMIPFIWSERPDSAVLELVADMARDPEGHPMLEKTRVLLPVGDLDVQSHGPVLSASNNGFSLYGQVKAMYALEGGTGYWMGLMSGSVSGALGVAEIGGRTSFSLAWGRLVAHEFGHSMSLGHAPCGGAGSPDPHFPMESGLIGAWGYREGVGLLAPHSFVDLMTYCEPRWISDYHFTKALGYRLADEVDAGPSGPAAIQRSLLLWGGADEDGDLFLNPAFVVDAPAALPESGGNHRITGRTGGGAELFSFDFDMPELSEGGSSFAFVLPVRSGWADSLASITLSGPGDRYTTLDADSDLPMAILRDPVTGQVRAFLRDVPALADAGADALELAGLSVLFSRGVPDADAWRR